MTISMQYNWLMVTLVICGLGSGGCKPKPEREQLPAEVPQVPTLEFTGPEQGWPPQVKNITDRKPVPWEPIQGSLTDSMEMVIRRAASSDARVRKFLGARSAYIGTDEMERDKDASADTVRTQTYRVTFFSYGTHQAVEALMRGSKVIDVKAVEGYQPPEGLEEVHVAIALAKRDERLRGKVEGLIAAALLAHFQEGQSGAGHRVLHVTFTKQDQDIPSYSAMVDLTEQKVLSAGAER